MTPERLLHLRKKVFKETRAEFAARTGIAERTLQRYEDANAGSEIPLVLGLAISARIYGLPPYGFPMIPKMDIGDPDAGDD